MSARRHWLALCLLGVVAACGPSPPAPTPTPRTSAPAAFSGSPFPAVDTPLNAAPSGLAALWRPYGVTLIPAASVVDGAAAAAASIPAINRSAGAFTDAQMAQFLLADMRNQLLVGWAAEHVQASLGPYLAGEPFNIGSDALAEADGTAVHLQSCSLIPTSAVLLAPSPAFDASLVKIRSTIVPGSFPLRLTFPGCAVTGTTRSGAVVTLDPASGPAVVVVDFVLRHDPLLGDLLYPEGGAGCSAGASASIAALCKA